MSKTYVELIIEGPDEFARGFITGFVAASGSHAELIFDDEAGFADDGPLQKLKEALRLSDKVTHCVVDDQTAALVREAIASADANPLVVRSDRVIADASFAYDFEIFNRENGDKLLQCLKDVPASVKLVGHEQETKLNPDARGAEMFAPEHDYALVGHGTAVGPVDKIVWLFKEFDSISQVRVEPIHVRYA